jgi:hypothetical protein
MASFNLELQSQNDDSTLIYQLITRSRNCGKDLIRDTVPI